jgi:flagellar FliJ protein
MKKYSFRFRTLLNIRSLQQEEAERNFREAIIYLGECIERLDELRDELAALLEEMAEHRKTGLHINYQLLYLDYIKVLFRRIDEQKLAVAEAEKKVEERREELIEAVKRKKMIEKLDMKEYDAYLLELRRWEQSIIDDLSILRHSNEIAANVRLM